MGLKSIWPPKQARQTLKKTRRVEHRQKTAGPKKTERDQSRKTHRNKLSKHAVFQNTYKNRFVV